MTTEERLDSIEAKLDDIIEQLKARHPGTTISIYAPEQAQEDPEKPDMDTIYGR